MVYTCQWGILATGGIARTFTKDLLVEPSTRKVDDVRHRVVAIGSSSSLQKAEAFAKELEVDAHCYGSYSEFLADPEIEIVYVATPHSHHFQNVKQCLEAGKNVLCEKPFTVNAKQAQILVDLAKSRGLFMMEAVWTRFFPLSIELQRLLFKEKVIGQIRRVDAELGMPFKPEICDLNHRLMNPELAGGALLDLGIYALTWVYMTCFDDPRNERQEAIVSSSMLKTERTGVDEYTNISLVFPKSRVMATASCNMNVKSNEQCICRIQGDEGDITVQWPAFRPTQFTLFRKDAPKDVAEAAQPYSGLNDGEVKVFDIPNGHGMFWEADECARCLEDGRKESARMPLSETLSTMHVLDVVRAQNNFQYPESIETTS